MIAQHPVRPNGRGLRSPAVRCCGTFVAIAALVAAACAEPQPQPDNSARVVVGSVIGSGCDALPDSVTAIREAQPDRNDLPVTRLILAPGCPRASVRFVAAAGIQRNYRVDVPAGHTLLAQAIGAQAGVVIAFDFPATPAPDRSNVGRRVVDSLRVTEDRQVTIRVMLAPKLREEPRASEVILTALVRP